MRIADILRSRGTTTVVTVSPEDTVSHLLAVLAEHRIGAVVVSSDSGSLAGIASERDVVRHLHRRGPQVLEAPVSSIMTTTVHTCTADEGLPEIARLMTDRRIRHLPVVRDGELESIVSIGDVVKFRIEQLVHERDQLENYITT